MGSSSGIGNEQIAEDEETETEDDVDLDPDDGDEDGLLGPTQKEKDKKALTGSTRRSSHHSPFSVGDHSKRPNVSFGRFRETVRTTKEDKIHNSDPNTIRYDRPLLLCYRARDFSPLSVPKLLQPGLRRVCCCLRPPRLLNTVPVQSTS